jgi:hypothetical protein
MRSATSSPATNGSWSLNSFSGPTPVCAGQTRLFNAMSTGSRSYTSGPQPPAPRPSSGRGAGHAHRPLPRFTHDEGPGQVADRDRLVVAEIGD